MIHVHDFVTIGENRDAIVEVCKECKVKKTFRKDNKGRTDNVEYLKEHARDFAQPTGATSKTFNRFYKIKK